MRSLPAGGRYAAAGDGLSPGLPMQKLALAVLLGLGLIILGATMVGYAVVRFHRVGALLAEGRYQTSALGPLLIGLVAAVACIGSVILVLLAA